MSVVDIIIIIFLLFGLVIGWKNGFTKQLISTVGFILVIVLAYILKNPVSGFFYKYLPFFDFGGSLRGVEVVNILLYEFLAFIIVFAILMSIFRVLLNTSSFFEKILNATIILGIPSKILGSIIGLIENYMVAFILLYFLSIPMVNLSYMNESKLTNKILDNTPILSDVCKDTLELFDEINTLKEKYIHDTDKTELNKEVLRLMLEHKVISKENVNNLVSHGKIKNIELED